MNLVDHLPINWKVHLQKKWSNEALEIWSSVMSNLLANKPITPPLQKVFRAFEYNSPEKIKVVILGQDPYPSFGHADGMAFSTNEDVFPFPKSLNTIFKELKRSISGYKFPPNGNLDSWAHQGVLLLNTCLTTEIGVVNAHRNVGWEKFTKEILSIASELNDNLVILLWGKSALKYSGLFVNSKHLVLSTSHPSPLSAYRGFLGCDHFVRCNQYLKEKGQKEIKW